MTDSRRSSPVVSLELEAVAAKKRIRKKRATKTDRDVSHQFLCYECPKVQVCVLYIVSFVLLLDNLDKISIFIALEIQKFVRVD